MTVRILRNNIKLIKIKATLHFITIQYITFFCYCRLALAQEQRPSQTKSWRSLFVDKVPRMCYCYVAGSICCPLAEKLCGPLHLLFVWKNIRNEYWTWSGSSGWEKTPQPHFLFPLSCSFLMQVFPPKVELLFPLAVPLIFVQPTGELTKQLGGWCFGPTGCKSQGQSQRCISWSLDPDVTPSWHLCPQQDKRTGEVAHDTLQK